MKTKFEHFESHTKEKLMDTYETLHNFKASRKALNNMWMMKMHSLR